MFINAQTVLKKEITEPGKQKRELSQKSQTSDITNMLMQMLQNQQWQINQMMTTFMNFAYTPSPTPTPSSAALTTQAASTSPANDDFLYIKFPDLPLFNNNHNEYLMWKQKTFDKLLTEDQKYAKMGTQADYLQQHYVNSWLNNSTAAKVLPWLDLNPSASMEEFWIFMNLQFKNNQLAEQALSKLNSLKQKEKPQIYVQKFNQLTMKANLVSPSTSEMFDIHLSTKHMLFNRDLKNEIQIHVLLILRNILFNKYVKQIQQADDELYQ